MALKFITGNKTKALEFNKVLAPLKIEQVDMDLAEIQEIDGHKIIKHKLQEAFKHQAGEFVVEDSSLYMDCLGGKLPGPLIRWFNETIGNFGLAQLAEKFGEFNARAVTIIGYAKTPENIIFFEGEVKGTIVQPKGQYKFGYDTIFVPKNNTRTLSELKESGNFELSPRGLAVMQLKKYLLKEQ